MKVNGSEPLRFDLEIDDSGFIVGNFYIERDYHDAYRISKAIENQCEFNLLCKVEIDDRIIDFSDKCILTVLDMTENPAYCQFTSVNSVKKYY